MHFWIAGVFLLAAIAGADGTSGHQDDVLDMQMGQYQAIGAVVLLISLVALVAMCAEMQVNEVALAPTWVQSISPDPALDVGIMGCSDGMNIINNNCVHRHRRGGFESDGARWGAPLSKGKHVFEIYWPTAMRSTHATVGVGSDDAPLFIKPKDSLVGSNKQSWGLDIARRRVLHNNQMLQNLPKNGLVPDKFYMYIDCDSCTVGYGTDAQYYGAPLRFGKEKLPVYAMVGCMCENAQITLIYRGSENRAGAPGQMNTVVVPSQGPQGVQVTVVNPGTVQTQQVVPDDGAGGAPEPAKY